MADHPKRIQLSRAKGWRMPAGAVKVDRSTRWGNPFAAADLRDIGYRGSDAALAGMCVTAFRNWLAGSDRDWMGEASSKRRADILDNIHQLRGRDLACWCPPGSPCHADVLLEIAND